MTTAVIIAVVCAAAAAASDRKDAEETNLETSHDIAIYMSATAIVLGVFALASWLIGR